MKMWFVLFLRVIMWLFVFVNFKFKCKCVDLQERFLLLFQKKYRQQLKKELQSLKSMNIKLDINVKMEDFVVKKIIFLLY